MSSVQSIREIIDVTQSLEVGDEVEFTDGQDVSHSGKIVERQKRNSQNNWLVKSTGDTPDSVLELLRDREGGPVAVQVSFESQDSRDVKHMSKVV